MALACALVLAFAPGTLAKDPPAKTEQEKQQQNAELHAALTRGWQMFYAGKYEETFRQAQALAKLESKSRWVALEAMHLSARACLAADTPPSRTRAWKLWQQLERLNASNSTKIRLQLAKALALAAEAQAAGQPVDAARLKAAINLLEPLLGGSRWNLASVEVALELSRLYCHKAVGRFEEAKKTLEYLIAYLSDAKNLLLMELPTGLEQPHLAAAKAALAHLKYDRNLGLEPFEAAEKLRRAEKYAEAMRAYQSLLQTLPDSAYAPAAELHIGHCLLGLHCRSEALAHWKRFIEAKPAGEYRAQALLALMDVHLEEQLNLPEAARYGEIARASLPTALADEKAGPSWKEAAFDLQLRIGLVAFCAGRGEQAVEAFQAAKQLTAKRTVSESLEALLAAAKSGKGVIPEDVKGNGSGRTSPADQAALVLSMGIIHLVAGNLDKAEALFTRVLGTPAVPGKSAASGQPARPAMAGATPAQLAFAIFGRAAVLQAQNKPEEAKALFLASIKAFGDGSWQDESFYRLAIIAQDELNAKFSKSAEPSAPSGKTTTAGKGAKSAKPLTAAEKEAAAKAEKERLANLFKAQQDVLGYWRELLNRYPKSSRIEYASWAVAQLQYEMAQAAPAERSAQLFKDAAFSANRFCKAWPKSYWAGEAYIQQVDIALERTFALKNINGLAGSISEWARTCKTAKSDVVIPPWGLRQPCPTNEALSRCVYDCFLKAAIIDYLGENYDQAVAWLKEAEPTEPEPSADLPDSQIEVAGLYYCQKAIESKKLLTPQEALDNANTEELKLAIRLGDLYLESLRPTKAEALFVQIAKKQAPFMSVNIDTQSYAILRLGIALDRQSKRGDEALEWLNRFAGKEFNHSSWKGDGLFQLALLTYNVKQNPRLSFPIYQEFLAEYPKHSRRELAYYYAIADACEMRDIAIAKDLAEKFIKAYPESKWIKSIQKRMSNAGTESNHRKGE